MRLWCSHDVSSLRLILPKVLPSTDVTLFRRYYDLSDFLTVISISSLLHLSTDTFITERTVRTSHVHLSTFITCRALRPRGCHVYLPMSDIHDGAFWFYDTISRPTNRINGAQSLQPEGLRPAISLSTLNSRRCRHELKTRYRMCWVNTFLVALSATSRIGASWRTVNAR